VDCVEEIASCSIGTLASLLGAAEAEAIAPSESSHERGFEADFTIVVLGTALGSLHRFAFQQSG
jgi:hypothetical protein